MQAYNRAFARIYNERWIDHARYVAPILRAYYESTEIGAEDKVVPVSGCHLLYDGVSSSDKTMKIYPGLYHEIHNEPEQVMVLTDIADWLDSHSQPV